MFHAPKLRFCDSKTNLYAHQSAVFIQNFIAVTNGKLYLVPFFSGFTSRKEHFFLSGLIIGRMNFYPVYIQRFFRKHEKRNGAINPRSRIPAAIRLLRIACDDADFVISFAEMRG